jgi:hypothetical protein
MVVREMNECNPHIELSLANKMFAKRGCITHDVSVFGAHSAPPSSADKPGAVGEHCLSAWPRSGSRELRSRPAWRATQGTRAAGGAGGALLFG